MHSLLFPLAILGCLSCTLLAHPFHVSTAEMEFNPSSAKIEVSLRMQAVDLESALSQMERKSIVIDKTPNVDLLIKQYLNATFFVARPNDNPQTSQAAKRSSIEFVGKEIDGTWIWVYFELPVPKIVALHLTNRVLLDVSIDQINSCILRNGARRESLVFDAKTPTLEIPTRFLTSSPAFDHRTPSISKPSAAATP